jgi:hypothetical protein
METRSAPAERGSCERNSGFVVALLSTRHVWPLATMTPAPTMQREAIATLIVKAVGAVLMALAVGLAVVGLRRRLAAGDERGQPVHVAVGVATAVASVAAITPFAAIVVAIVPRSAAVLAAAILLLARREELRVTGQIRLRIASAECRLLGVADRLAGGLLIAFIEGIIASIHAATGFLPITKRLILTHLILSRRNHAEIMFGVLEIILRCNRISGRLRVPSELHVFFGDMRCGAADFNVRSVGLVNACQWIVAFAVPSPHALVLTVSHGSLFANPYACDDGQVSLTSPDDQADHLTERFHI